MERPQRVDGLRGHVLRKLPRPPNPNRWSQSDVQLDVADHQSLQRAWLCAFTDSQLAI